MELFNTKTRSIERFRPRKGNRVLFYACGPSVYNFAHIGNLRTFFWEDVLRRALAFNGYDVRHAMPVSDIEDKAIKAFNASGEKDFEKFITPKIARFRSDMKKMNILAPTSLVRFKSAIPWVIKWISGIESKGYAYGDSSGNLLFKAGKVKDYGRLVRLTGKKRLNRGARLADDYAKEGVYDFALWKAAAKEDGSLKWESPWGEGRPGTHSYCSAIAYKWLGEKIDIHAGGVDNIFPHHENEIAQSECFAGDDFVGYWFHVKHLTVNKKKMSKRIGNVHYLAGLEKMGFSGQDLRYFYLQRHYRQNQDFNMREMRRARKNRTSLVGEIAAIRKSKPVARGGLGEVAMRKAWDSIMHNIDSDLRMHRALAAFEGLARKAARKGMDKEGKKLFIERAREFGYLTGLTLF
ncbi:MAG: cysteine--tRNA ligase [Candidatus Micrarchaeia archaeon]